MPAHFANVVWERKDQPFTDNQYSREHRWSFDGGAVVPASSSPHSVRIPLSNPACVDPEEAFVAALSSCHMLWFLSLAAKEGLRVDRYEDPAEGVLEKNTEGQQLITRVTLKPRITFSGTTRPTEQQVDHLHHRAHELCYLANSVKTEIRIAGTWNHEG